jgi:hypothetical protein
MQPVESCLRLLLHVARRADSRAALMAGSNRPTRIPMIVMTTRSSMSVKAARQPSGTVPFAGGHHRQMVAGKGDCPLLGGWLSSRLFDAQ